MAEAVAAALQAGYRHIDTATMYGNEGEVGRALADSGLDRGSVFLTTKLPSGRADRERATLAASLRALGTGHVDLWLVHWPPPGRKLCHVWQEFLTDRKSTRLNSSHPSISYAVFCLKKKKTSQRTPRTALAQPSSERRPRTAAARPSTQSRPWMASARPSRQVSLFFFNDTATTEIYTLSLHDALPI